MHDSTQFLIRSSSFFTGITIETSGLWSESGTRIVWISVFQICQRKDSEKIRPSKKGIQSYYKVDYKKCQVQLKK